MPKTPSGTHPATSPQVKITPSGGKPQGPPPSAVGTNIHGSPNPPSGKHPAKS